MVRFGFMGIVGLFALAVIITGIVLLVYGIIKKKDSMIAAAFVMLGVLLLMYYALTHFITSM